MSFRWNALVRRSSWIAFRKFILEEHQDIDRRLLEIDRQLTNIGDISVLYEKVDGNRTQKRTGVIVQKNTSIHKLCMAYTAQGGNILDISMFLNPSKSFVNEEGGVESEHPLDGRISPLSGNPSQLTFIGGWVGLDKHPFWKVGRAEIPDEPKRKIEKKVQSLRKGFEKEIKVKRNRIEEKIIKLCDLREQLENERDELNMIRGQGTDTSFANHTHIGYIDRILWIEDEDNPKNVNPNTPRIYTSDFLAQDIDTIEQDEGLALRTLFVNVFEDAESDKYPITSL